MLALICPPLIAESTPPPISVEWQGGFIALLLIVHLCLGIWDKLKRKPALDETFDKKIQALADAAERRTQAQCVETDKKIDALDRRREAGEKEIRQLINDQVTQMEKFISRQITDNRESNTGQFGALFEKVDASQNTMRALSNDVMLHIGRLEGQLSELAKRAA